MTASRQTIQVKDNPSLVRDTYSKAIINTDVSAYAAVCNRRNQKLKYEITISDLYTQIEELWLKIDELLEWKESVVPQLATTPKGKKKLNSEVI